MEKVTFTNQELVKIQRPAQYLGGELNSVTKNIQEITCRFALCFPDTYEVGMSHVGIQILYDIINKTPYAWAERAYMPFPDMEHLLKTTKKPLYSLESKTPLKEFDIVGFSLQYELCGTNILAMLDLAGIPFYSSDRDDSHPLIIGGGPYSYHPEALAPFFDIFFLGDAEEFLPELLELVDKHKKNNSSINKNKFIEEVSKIEGIYIPDHFKPHYKINEKNELQLDSIIPKYKDKQSITRRLLPTLSGAPFPNKPVVPNTEIVHNRFSLEVMRGCVRGCRFCQAGYLYRPQRERSPEEITEIIQNVLPNTGFEEISLLSLSTADYCSIVPLLKSLMDKYGQGETLAISFPSTRVDALKPELLEQVQRVRRTNFTIAPEGGSQRLRDVINKGVTDDQILETCDNVFKMGWSGIKLYFMIGLPTETDEDIECIIDLAKRIKKMPSAKNKEITVSVSTHVPKPHTPFQWAKQITPEETIRLHKILSSGLKRIGVSFRYHDYFSTFLEGVFCRSGRELAPTIVRAYELGARLDAWQDHLKEDIWQQAFRDTNINPYYYLRERLDDEIFPWEHLSCEIPKSYFFKEYKRAIKERTTPDCLTTSCSTCGACNYDTKKNILWPRSEAVEKLKMSLETTDESIKNTDLIKSFQPAIKKIRACYNKSEIFKYLGHLEFSTLIQRALRRANIPVCYSMGFHPLPKISFGPPLSLGISSSSEFFDILIFENLSTIEFLNSINENLPLGIKLTEAKELPLKSNSLQQDINTLKFKIFFLDNPKREYYDFLNDTSLIGKIEIIRKNKKFNKPEKVFILSNFLSEFELKNNGMNFSLKICGNNAAPSPLEITRAISGLEIDSIEIEKTQTFFCNNASN